MYAPKKEPKERIAFGILQENFNEGYAKVMIAKFFQNLNLPKYIDINPKLCSYR